MVLTVVVAGGIVKPSTGAQAVDVVSQDASRTGYVISDTTPVVVPADVEFILDVPEIEIETEPEFVVENGVVVATGSGSGSSYSSYRVNNNSGGGSSGAVSGSGSGDWYGVFTSALASAGCAGTPVSIVPGLTWGGRSVVALAGNGIRVNPDYLAYYSAAHVRSVAWHECAHILGATSEGVASAYAEIGSGVQYDTGDASYVPTADDYVAAAALAAPAPAPVPEPAPAPAPAPEPTPVVQNPATLEGVVTSVTVTGPGEVAQG